MQKKVTTFAASRRINKKRMIKKRYYIFIFLCLITQLLLNSCRWGKHIDNILVSDSDTLTSIIENKLSSTQKYVEDDHFNDFSTVGLPIISDTISSQILYRKAYVTSYNYDTHIPNWVVWHLTAEHVDGPIKRLKNAFHEDLDVDEPRVNSSDYYKSGWTRGHMCPCGDNKWDSVAMYESFLYTNICPQSARNNTGLWNSIEISCRNWAKKNGDIYIVTGPILFQGQHETIGENHVVVPEAFFKVILCLNGTPKGIGFICRNTDSGRKDNYVNSISQVERITGYSFFPNLSDTAIIRAKEYANIDQW